MLNNIKKEMLKKEPQALKVWHNAEGIDYKKEFVILKHDGKFTTNALEKEAANAGYFWNDSKILCYTIGVKHRENTMYMYKLTGGGGFYIDYKPWKFTTGRAHSNIDNLYAKKQLDAIRKEEDITTYIICQKKADTAPENLHPVNLANRFILKDFNKSGYKGESYIDRVHLKRTDDTGSEYTYNDHGQIIYTSYYKYTAIDEIIDKSGYIVNKKRDDLKRRAEALRAERAKAAYLQTDNAEIISELENLFTETKAAIIEELKAAGTYEELKAVYKKLDTWHGLTDCRQDLDRLKENDAARKYSSIERFTTAADGIRAALEKLTTNEE